MKKCKVFVPAGGLGFGTITPESMEMGLELEPDVISCDAGSTDSGPYYLGTGKGKYANDAVKEEMKLMIKGGQKLSIPVLVGTAGTCGVNKNVDELAQICKNICEEEGIKLKIAKVYTELSREVLYKKFKSGQIKPLEGAPEISNDTFDQCNHVVGLAGAEPFIKALEEGADVVLCGRATDTAVIAAMPLMKGCNVAASWHGAKIAECGPLCTTNPTEGGVLVTFDDNGFIIEATAEGNSCSTYSVSAHMSYENSDPYKLIEPSGELDTYNSTYYQIDDKRVMVTGSEFKQARKNTMKLEGAGSAGYQTITIVGIQDRKIMRNLTKWIDELTEFVNKRLDDLNIPRNEFSFQIKPYGWNAVTEGEVPIGFIPNEIGILLVVNASTQELATQVAKVFNPSLLHFPLDKEEQAPTFAFPFSPAEIEKGQVYEFKLHHIVEVDYPLELINIEYMNV